MTVPTSKSFAHPRSVRFNFFTSSVVSCQVPDRAVSAWTFSTMRLMLFFDGRYPRYAFPVLAEYIRPNVCPRKSNFPSGTLQIRVFSSLTVSFSLPMISRNRRRARLQRYYEPLRHPRAPACPSRASGWSSLNHASGFPVLRTLSLCTCCRQYPGAAAERIAFAHFTQPYQPSPIWQSGRPAHRPFRGLLGVHSRYGLHTRAVS